MNSNDPQDIDETQNCEELRLWARGVYYAQPNGASTGTVPRGRKPPHNRQAAIGALRQWLLQPEQSGVLEALRTGLAQLCWDTPSSSGRRLIADLIWHAVLIRFGIVPALTSDILGERIVIDVADSPSRNDTWDFSGWRVYVNIYSPHRTHHSSENRQPEIEFVLNALLYYDVELGLADRPLYERLRPTTRSSKPDNVGVLSGTASPNCPSCGAPMRLKGRSRTHEPFWGCTNYPACKGKRPLLAPPPGRE